MPRRPPLEPGRDYSEEERQWLVAVDRWRRKTGRKFPSACDLLALAVALGYRKVAPAEPLPKPRPTL